MELQVRLRPGAKTLGFDVATVATQVRGFLFGAKAHTFPDRQEDIEVRVRFPELTRRNLWLIENAWLVNPIGRAVPLLEVASLKEGATYANIRREEGRRAVSVFADTAIGLSPEKVVLDITRPIANDALREKIATVGDLPQLRDNPELSPFQAFRKKYPELNVEFGGRQKQTVEAFASLPYGFLAAIVMIYIVLAWLFASYSQPIVVLMAVPFSIVGVIWGHYVLGYDLTFLSLIGFVALSGIVVNDSLIFVEFFNKRRSEGVAFAQALVDAGRARFRAIFLTTATTVVGLLPIMLEKSFHAQFLVTMAVSVAMGLISATVLILVVLPCMIMVMNDVRRAFQWLWSR